MKKSDWKEGLRTIEILALPKFEEMFNLEEVRRASGLSAPELARLEGEIRGEFEGDEMMFELHLMRAIRAIKEGWITLEGASSKRERI